MSIDRSMVARLSAVLWSAVVVLSVTVAMPSAAADTTDKSYFGLHVGGTDFGTEWPPKVAFGSWRLWDAYVQWPELQPSRRDWRFDRLDRYVELSRSAKVSILLPLGLSPRWASMRPNEISAYGEGKAAEPRSLEDWRNYVRTVATRYKGRITEYEIWNEPNDVKFFSGTIESLVELTCSAYSVLKEIDPAIRVVSPAYTGEGNVTKLDEFLSKGGARCIDVVAFHFYVVPAPPEAIPQSVRTVQAAMDKNKVGHLPLWNTETGWAMKNEDGTSDYGRPERWQPLRGGQAAAFVARALILGRASGVDRFYWYAWDNRILGLMEPTTKTHKSGAVAFDVVSRWLTGSKLSACNSTGAFWVCRIDTKRDERLIVWKSSDGQGTFTLPVDRTVLSIERCDLGVAAIPTRGKVVVDEVPVMIRLSRRS